MCCCHLFAIEKFESFPSDEGGWKGGRRMATVRRSFCAVPLDSSLRRSSLAEVMSSKLIQLALIW